MASPLFALVLAAASSAPAGPQLAPLALDLRAAVSPGFLLSHLGTGVLAEIGVARAGRGTLSAGAEAAGSVCLLACGAELLFARRARSQLLLSAMGRAAYHFSVSNRNYRETGFFAGVMGGWVSTQTSLRSAAGRARGKDTGPIAALVFGGNYFVGRHLFVGAEIRAQYARGTYRLEVLSGDPLIEDEHRTWSLIGLPVMFFVGARI